jgi:hypothetical protein
VGTGSACVAVIVLCRPTDRDVGGWA